MTAAADDACCFCMLLARFNYMLRPVPLLHCCSDANCAPAFLSIPCTMSMQDAGCKALDLGSSQVDVAYIHSLPWLQGGNSKDFNRLNRLQHQQASSREGHQLQSHFREINILTDRMHLQDAVYKEACGLYKEVGGSCAVTYTKGSRWAAHGSY